MALSDILSALGGQPPQQQPLQTITPESVKRRRMMADALTKSGMDYSPVQSPWQGAARVANALVGSLEDRQLDQQEAQGRAAAQKQLTDLFLGGSASPPPNPSSPAPATPQGQQTAPPSMPQAPKGAQSAIPAGKDEFVSMLLPAALEASKATGVDPRLIIAQSAVETGWGKHAPGNNYFGIKSHGQAGGQQLGTTEYVNGQPVRTADNFRTYASPQDSVMGYADFITKNPRYQEMRNAPDLNAQIAALGRSGYATDPSYGSMVGRIAQSLNLPQVASLDPSAGVQGGGAPPMPQPRPPEAGPGMPMAAAPEMVAPPPQAGQGAPQQAAPTRVAQAGPNIQGIVQALNNPWLTDGERATLLSLAKDRIAQSNPVTQQMQALQLQKLQNEVTGSQYEKLNDGTLFDKRTGKTVQAGGPAYRPLTDPAERARFGIPEDDKSPYQVDAAGKLMSAGRAGTTVNIDQKGDSAFETALGGAQGKLFAGMLEDGVNARSDLGMIGQLRDQLDKVKGGFVGGAQAIASNFGIKIGPNVSNLEAAQAIINQMVPKQRIPGSGTTSDRDLELFKRSLPQIQNTKGGNALILDTMQALAEYRIQQSEIANSLASKDITRQEALKLLKELPDPFAAFKAARAEDARKTELRDKYGLE